MAVLAAALLAGLLAVVRAEPADAAIHRSNGWRTSGSVTPAVVRRGSVSSMAVRISSTRSRRAFVSIRVVDASGRKVHQKVWDSLAFTAGRRRTLRLSWRVPAGEQLGSHRVVVRIRPSGGGRLLHANGRTAAFSVARAPARGGTLPVGAVLPSDATCAARVRDAGEIRPANRTFNQTTGRASSNVPAPLYRRVTGDYTGTTDEIIQWAACKWGIDADIVRAQTVRESYWFQRAAGDFTSDPANCVPGHPIGADGRPGQCPESIGVQQVRYPYWGFAFPWAINSTAYNLDVAMAARRNCFEGNETWLNTVERGRQYAAGDIWGCVGVWFSGRWYAGGAVEYTGEVRQIYADKIWTTPGFRSAT